MVRDPVANVVYQLGERGFAPRKLGHDAWESRCPAHRGSDYSLSITRNEFNHVVLECRSSENCQHIRIVRALGWTNEHVYAETADWLISRLGRVEIHLAQFKCGEPEKNDENMPSSALGTTEPDGALPSHEVQGGKDTHSGDEPISEWLYRNACLFVTCIREAVRSNDRLRNRGICRPRNCREARTGSP
jgi:hypothetical protein